jgi:hypothetical protein
VAFRLRLSNRSLSVANIQTNARFWHLADIGLCAAHVRF